MTVYRDAEDRGDGHHGVWDTKEGVRTQGRNEVWGKEREVCYFLILRKETSPRQRGKETQVEMEKNGKLRKKCLNTTILSLCETVK